MRSSTWILWLVLASANGCGDDDAGVTAVRPIFDPAVLGGAGGFFDFPYPSDLRTDTTGHPSLAGFPARLALIRDSIAVIETERPGFSPLVAGYFRFTGALDSTALPTPAQTLDPASSVILVDIDVTSPERGTQFPVQVAFRAESSAFWEPNTLVARAVPGMSPHPGRRYALVIREGLLAADGTAVMHADAFEDIRARIGPAEIVDHYARLFRDLELSGVSTDGVIVATSFTTADPAEELDALRRFLQTAELPVVTSWAAGPSTSRYRSYSARFETYEFFSGEYPYDAYIGEGGFRFDADMQPMDVSRRTVAITVTVPATAMPRDGYPLVLYGHGTGGDSRTHVRDEGSKVANVGLAMMGFDAALHGIRNPDAVDPEALLLTNPIASREMIRQTVADMMLLYRMLASRSFEIPASVTGAQMIRFDPSPTLYMGHSQGSQEAGLLLGVESNIDAAFLSEGGGGAVITIVEREFSGQPIACAIALAIGEACSAVTEDHPAIGIIVQSLLDPADPLVYAHRFIRERQRGWKPLSVAMTEGTEDDFTPPRAIEALAAAIGLPIVEPVHRTSLPYDLMGAAPITAPVQGNLATSWGDRVTGGLMQWPGAGHFVIYDDADAANRYAQFLRSAADGAPVIPAPL